MVGPNQPVRSSRKIFRELISRFIFKASKNSEVIFFESLKKIENLQNLEKYKNPGILENYVFFDIFENFETFENFGIIYFLEFSQVS